MSAGIDIDPLDAYMDSIASEVTQQATETPTPSPPARPPATSSLSSHQQLASPTPAQSAIAEKVSVSPFCDVLTSAPRVAGVSWEHRTGTGIADCACAGQPNEAGGSVGGGGSGDAAEACLRLLLSDPAEFLR